MIVFEANCPLNDEEASHWALPGAVPMSIHGRLPRRCCSRQLTRWSQWSLPPGIHTCQILSLWITCCNELNASTPGDVTSMIRLGFDFCLASRLCSLSLWWNKFGRLTWQGNEGSLYLTVSWKLQSSVDRPQRNKWAWKQILPQPSLQMRPQPRLRQPQPLERTPSRQLR